MRLEIDTTVSAPPIQEIGEGVDTDEVKSALNQGIKFAQAGNRPQARVALLRATELDPRNESAWLWLASISEYPEELLGFLNQVLDINPENQRAVEWKTATHSLLSKTFVHRGIDASQENQREFAAECFETALEYDDRNAAAWMWMASMSDSNADKVPLLAKALALDPENDEAAKALDLALASILKERLAEAKAAAMAGNHGDAVSILDALLAVNSNSIEAWMMKSHLSDAFDEKVRCFDNILAIDPNNVAAMSGRDSLLSIFGNVEAAEAVQPAPSEETINPAPEEYSVQLEAAVTDENPIQDVQTEEPIYVEAEFVYELANEHTPEAEDENEEPKSVAEPFASFAEETPQPFEAATSAHEELVSDTGRMDPVYEAAAEEVFVPDSIHFEPHHDDETVAFNYHVPDDPSNSQDHPDEHSDEQWSGMTSAPAIEMPADALRITENSEHHDDPAAFEVAPDVVSVRPDSIECSFCGATNDTQAISCQSCLAVLTLSDLEFLLAHQSLDTMKLRQYVDQMERQRLTREFEPGELVTLGLGHLNLRNFQTGYSCLFEASKLSPNNVVLAAQVNSLLIRLEEIKQQEEVHLKMPKGKSILVVDDSPTVRKLIAGKLEKSGHAVTCANDGIEAMERIGQFVPDLVLLDIEMPRMDGYQVCKQIRSNAATKDVTVVMISGKDGFFDKVRGRMAGAAGYITKPFGPEALMKAVEMYLSGDAPELDEVDGLSC